MACISGFRRKWSCPSRFSAACPRTGRIPARRRDRRAKKGSRNCASYPNCLLPEQALDYAQAPRTEGGIEGAKRTYCILRSAFARGDRRFPLAVLLVPHHDDARRAEHEGARRPGDKRVHDRAEERRPESRDRESLDEGRDEPEQEPVEDEDKEAEREDG